MYIGKNSKITKERKRPQYYVNRGNLSIQYVTLLGSQDKTLSFRCRSGNPQHHLFGYLAI